MIYMDNKTDEQVIVVPVNIPNAEYITFIPEKTL